MEEALRWCAFGGWAEDDFKGVGNVAGEWRGIEKKRIAGGVAAFGIFAVGVSPAFEVNSISDGRVYDLRPANGGNVLVADFGKVVKAPGDGLLGEGRN